MMLTEKRVKELLGRLKKYKSYSMRPIPSLEDEGINVNKIYKKYANFYGEDVHELLVEINQLQKILKFVDSFYQDNIEIMPVSFQTVADFIEKALTVEVKECEE